jgi:hypothetical protein
MPPIWINRRMINLPKVVNSVAVFLTINPVTQTADVAVYRASINEMVREDIGNKSKIVPTKITNR